MQHVVLGFGFFYCLYPALFVNSDIIWACVRKRSLVRLCVSWLLLLFPCSAFVASLIFLVTVYADVL